MRSKDTSVCLQLPRVHRHVRVDHGSHLFPSSSFDSLCLIVYIRYSDRNQLLSCANRFLFHEYIPWYLSLAFQFTVFPVHSKTTRKDEAQYRRPYWLGCSGCLTGCLFDNHFVDTSAVMRNKVYVVHLPRRHIKTQLTISA